MAARCTLRPSGAQWIGRSSRTSSMLPLPIPIQTRSTTAEAPSAEVRPIVSSFISVGDVGTPSFRVALFKRSRETHVYPGLWAACSGSVKADDASPLAAALREIKEETGLQPPLIRLLKQGRPWRSEDGKLGAVWEIHPFVFSLHLPGEKRPEEAAIELNEEHSEVRFVTMDTMKSMRTVDNLRETLQRVLEAE